MKISGVCIAKNEERCIERWVESLKPCVDELVVVDTGSADRTVELAEKAGARVEHFEWIDDFSAAKNYAISQAAGDWIVMFDADEWLPTVKDAKALRKFIHEAPKQRIKGYFVMRQDFDADGNTSICPCLRVFKKTPNIFFEGRIHEYIDESKEPGTSAAINKEQLAVYHDGYVGEDRSNEKLERNFNLLLKQWEETPDPLTAYYVAREAVFLGKYELSYERVKEYIASGYTHPTVGPHGYFVYVLANRGIDGSRVEELQILEKGSKPYPGHPLPAILKSDTLLLEKQLDKALEESIHALELAKSYKADILEHTTNTMANKIPQVTTNIAKLLNLKRFDPRLIKWEKKALELSKNSKEQLADFLMATREESDDKLIAYLSTVYAENDVEEMGLLVDTMRNYRLDMVYLHFFEKWFMLSNQQDLRFISMMLIVGEYEAAFNMLAKRYEASGEGIYILKLLSVAMLDRTKRLLDRLRSFTDNMELRKFLDIMDTNTAISPELAQSYVFILQEMMLIAGSDDRTVSWLNYTRDSNPEVKRAVAEALMNAGLYERALAIYTTGIQEMLLAGTDSEKLAMDSYFAMQCCYYLRLPEQAMTHIKNAAAFGYEAGELREFAYWISQICEGGLKEEYTALAEGLNIIKSLQSGIGIGAEDKERLNALIQGLWETPYVAGIKALIE